MMYSLAAELGREDNDLLWLTIVGVSSMELYGRSSAGVAVPVRGTERNRAAGWLGVRGARIRQLLRDEVRRLNPPDASSGRSSLESAGVIPTTARSPEDTGIRLSPEPKFLLIRHWSLYDSMLHSPYLFSRLKTWSDAGLRRLHKLLAKMGVSLVQCRQSYAHMDVVLKRELRAKLLKYASLYNLDDMVPSVETDGRDRAGAKDGWGFVRSWGWRATLSAQDVGVVIGALLEVGRAGDGGVVPAVVEQEDSGDMLSSRSEEWVSRFWEAYDALDEYVAPYLCTPTFWKHLSHAGANFCSVSTRSRRACLLHSPSTALSTEQAHPLSRRSRSNTSVPSASALSRTDPTSRSSTTQRPLQS